MTKPKYQHGTKFTELPLSEFTKDDSEDEDYDDHIAASRPKTAKRSKRVSSHHSKSVARAKRRARDSYGGSDVTDSDVVEDSEPFSESQSESEPEVNEHGRRVRKAAAQRTYQEPPSDEDDVEDDDDEDQDDKLAQMSMRTEIQDSEDELAAAEARRTAPRPQYIIKLKVPSLRNTRSRRNRSISHPAQSRPTSAGRMTRQRARSSQEPTELVELSDSGHRAISAGSESKPPARPTRGGKGLSSAAKQPQTSVIIEASQEDSAATGGTNTDGELHRADELLDSIERQEVADSQPELLADLEDDGDVEMLSEHNEDEEDDDGPVLHRRLRSTRQVSCSLSANPNHLLTHDRLRNSPPNLVPRAKSANGLPKVTTSLTRKVQISEPRRRPK
jgi:hypothetical protein